MKWLIVGVVEVMLFCGAMGFAIAGDGPLAALFFGLGIAIMVLALVDGGGVE